MKRSFNSFFLVIINKEKKGLKFGSEENFTHYYINKGNFLEPLIAVLCDVPDNFYVFKPTIFLYSSELIIFLISVIFSVNSMPFR